MKFENEYDQLNESGNLKEGGNSDMFCNLDPKTKETLYEAELLLIRLMNTVLLQKIPLNS